MMQQSEQAIEITEYELNLQMHEFYLLFAGLVETSADSIIALSDDPEIQRNALRWKMYAIPAAQKAILVTDPLAGLIDAATLCIQQTNFFSEGAGSRLFGDWQPIALHTSARLEEETRNIAGTLSENRDISETEELLQQFASNHPIQSLHFARASTLKLMGEVLAAQKFGLGKTIANVNTSIDELGTRLNYYLDQVAKQFRWQAELMFIETLENAGIEARFDSITTLATLKVDSLVSVAEEKGDTLFRYIDRMTILAEGGPDFMDQQRQALTADLQTERAIILAALRRERIETMDQLAGERAIILDRISAEREAAFSELDSVIQHSIATSFQESERLIDKLYWRTLLILFFGGLFFLTALFMILRMK